ncbi:peptidase M14 [Peribacillus cavernae]|uniref:Peptidase M14 n=1 Tax=Peribacillus cavernae TaxID=1674310 RepID=A0A3S0W5V1_9BACI|nr:M14 family metallocarboxypeptidase [Peribacillus cavernae]MDQ0218317.1 g-D-glutamyl-meso-diaminopimelate peptidase [Peribacillus cavernae]RUQ28401.1 peptidase M14 [Peribacillus cavernae]
MKLIGRDGDTLDYYSMVFQLPIELLRDSNPHIADNQQLNGLDVCIPGFKLNKILKAHDVRLMEIAEHYHISLDGLLLMNEGLTTETETIAVPVRVIKPIIKTKKFYDYASLVEDLEKLKEVYPFIEIESIGKSVLGKELFEVRLGQGDGIVHYNGSFHANEWITTAILMKWLNELLLCLTNALSLSRVEPLPLYTGKKISMVPMVNPDGVELVLKGEEAAEGKIDVLSINDGYEHFYEWKANIRGVDLNNQYPANWEIEKERKIPQIPAPRDFPGEDYLTEPEALAMKELAYNRSFEKVIALHTQGKEFYWGYDGKEPLYASCIAEEFEKKSDYKSVRNIDSHAGYKDWFIQEFQRPGFTVELGEGINPLPLSQMKTIYRDTVGILMAGIYM